jgi:hypothetical protein
MGNLAGNRKQFELDCEAALAADHEGQQIEKQGSVSLGLKRHQLAAVACIHHIMQSYEVGGLSAERRPIVDQFDDQALVFLR